MVGVAPISRGINGACYELQSRPVATKRLALGRRGSFMIWYARLRGFTLRYSGRATELCLASLKMHHRATQRRQQTVRDPGSDDKLVEIILNIFTRNKSTRWALDPSGRGQGLVGCNRTAAKAAAPNLRVSSGLVVDQFCRRAALLDANWHGKIRAGAA